MRCRRKLSAKRRKLRKIIALTLCFIIFCLAYFEYAVKAQLQDVIKREMQTVAETAVNMAVDKFLSENFDLCDRLTSLTYNNGKSSAITTNSACVNSVKTYITELSQQYIDELSKEKGISTHLGSFTGLVLLTNVGPEVTFDVESSQTVSCEFQSSFESAGLNQTLHHITMTVQADLLIYTPFRIADTVTTSSTYEIAQTVIVGSVPSYGGVMTY